MDVSDYTLHDYVWYVCYGSNLKLERFLKYIQGGSIEGNSRVYKGCRDKSLPVDSMRCDLQGGLVYAGSFFLWSDRGCGVAFYDYKKDDVCIGRGYLITKQQFVDVLSQENHKEAGVLDHVFTEIFKTQGNVNFDVYPYDLAVKLPDINSYPAYTFTSSSLGDSLQFNHPSASYVNVLLDGLVELNVGSREKCLHYLQTRPGFNKGL